MAGSQEEGIGLDPDTAELPEDRLEKREIREALTSTARNDGSCTRAAEVEIQRQKLKSNCRGNNGRAS